MANIKQAFGTKTSITCTLTGLANGSARESSVVDNTTDLFRDALLRIKANGSAAGNTSVIEVYAYAALGDTTYTDGATGADAAFTAANIKNAPMLCAITMNGTTGVIAGPVSVATAFGGSMPAKWGLIFKNSSGAALSATAGDFAVEYQGVYDTVN